jgi:hypothetical protein
LTIAALSDSTSAPSSMVGIFWLGLSRVYSGVTLPPSREPIGRHS